jgi:hypothetical protein
MQGKFRAKQKLARAVSFGLTLSLSLSAAANDSLSAASLIADSGSLASKNATPSDASTIIARWRDYALSGVTPDFSWADHAETKSQPPSVLDNLASNSAVSSSTIVWHNDATRTDLRIGVSGDNLPEDRAFSSSSVRGTLLPESASSAHRDLISPTLEQRWGNQGIWGVSGILAYQRHTSLGFGIYEMRGENTYGSSAAAYGTGLGLSVANALNESLRWSAGFRSKIAVDDYNRSMGVYVQPGVYDIPSSYRLGLAYTVSTRQTLDLRAERIQYSATTPFVGFAPPSRVGAGGDGTANSIYAQRDLTVYSLGWTWHGAELGDWQLRYSTREQPLPASDALYHALKYRLSNYSLALSFGKMIGKYSELRVAASYAPTEYIFGAMNGFSSRSGGNQTELEALYLVHF